MEDGVLRPALHDNPRELETMVYFHKNINILILLAIIEEKIELIEI